MNQNEVMDLITIAGGKHAASLKRLVSKSKDCRVTYDDNGAHIVVGDKEILWITVNTYVASKKRS